MSVAAGSIRLACLLALPVLLGPGVAMATPADGTVLGVTKIVDNGPESSRFNLVLVGEGYQAGEQAAFAAHAQSFVDDLFATPPIDTSASAFNVWRLSGSFLRNRDFTKTQHT